MPTLSRCRRRNQITPPNQLAGATPAQPSNPQVNGQTPERRRTAVDTSLYTADTLLEASSPDRKRHKTVMRVEEFHTVKDLLQAVGETNRLLKDVALFAKGTSQGFLSKADGEAMNKAAYSLAHEVTFFFVRLDTQDLVVELSPYTSLADLKKQDGQWLNAGMDKMLAYNWTSTRANFTEMVKHKLPIFYKGICYDADGKLDQEKATRLMGDPYGSATYRALILEVIPGDFSKFYPGYDDEGAGQIYERTTIIHATASQLAMLETVVWELLRGLINLQDRRLGQKGFLTDLYNDFLADISKRESYYVALRPAYKKAEEWQLEVEQAAARGADAGE